MSAQKFLTIHPILVETFKFGLKTVKHSHPQSHAAKMLIKHEQFMILYMPTKVLKFTQLLLLKLNIIIINPLSFLFQD